MVLTHPRILDFLARLPFIDTGELAPVLGELLATVHRAITVLMKDGLAQRVSHVTAHLHSSHRYYLTKRASPNPPMPLATTRPWSLFALARRPGSGWICCYAVASVYRIATTRSTRLDKIKNL